ncbi:MAG TPA: hypothetical protein VGN42_13830 [Pirellulales bacterium]|jgi:hypothetical protein|nr:hypothetical protein [Pirellulales bacterium]
MNKLMIALAAIAAGVALCGAEDDLKKEDLIEVRDEPEYTELLDWLNGVKRPDFDLRRSSRTADFFFAVFKTRDGDAAFCYYPLKPPTVDKSYETWDVRDLQGNKLERSKPGKHRTLVRKFKITNPESEGEFHLVDGLVLPLRQPPPKKVRVVYSTSPAEGPWNTVFDEIIDFD